MSIFNEWRVGASQQMRKSEQLARGDHGNPATGRQPWYLPQFFLTVNKLILAVPCHQERVGGVKTEQEWMSGRREK